MKIVSNECLWCYDSLEQWEYDRVQISLVSSLPTNVSMYIIVYSWAYTHKHINLNSILLLSLYNKPKNIFINEMSNTLEHPSHSASSKILHMDVLQTNKNIITQAWWMVTCICLGSQTTKTNSSFFIQNTKMTCGICV